MAEFDSSKDKVFAVLECVLDETGNVLAHGSKVEQPDSKEHTRYRFTVASYNGGPVRLRRQTVYIRKRDGEERVSAAGSVPLAHAATLAKIGAALGAKASAKLAAA